MDTIKRFFHNLLGWGFPLRLKEADSFQPVYECKYCKHDICQDSTGAWFHLSSKSK